jgi:UDP-2,3-diacylglucosamine pyrophosphatase LpxH
MHLRGLSARGDVEIVWIAGNHDRHLAPIVLKLIGIETRESFSWSCGGRAYHALHGDCFDSFVSNYGRVSNLISRLFACCMRYLSRRGEWPLRLDRLHASLAALGEEVAEGVLRFATANPFDVIVCGHTHEPHHRVFDIKGPGGRGIEYFNTGAWLHSPASFLAVDAAGVTMNRCP